MDAENGMRKNIIDYIKANDENHKISAEVFRLFIINNLEVTHHYKCI